jgi:hypothetical protein
MILSIYKSFDWNYFFHRTIVEILFNNEIQIFSNQFIFWGEKTFLYITKNIVSLNYNIVIWAKS